MNTKQHEHGNVIYLNRQGIYRYDSTGVHQIAGNEAAMNSCLAQFNTSEMRRLEKRRRKIRRNIWLAAFAYCLAVWWALYLLWEALK